MPAATRTVRGKRMKVYSWDTERKSVRARARKSWKHVVKGEKEGRFQPLLVSGKKRIRL